MNKTALPIYCGIRGMKHCYRNIVDIGGGNLNSTSYQAASHHPIVDYFPITAYPSYFLPYWHFNYKCGSRNPVFFVQGNVKFLLQTQEADISLKPLLCIPLKYIHKFVRLLILHFIETNECVYIEEVIQYKMHTVIYWG